MTFPTIPTVAATRVKTAVQANTTATRTFPTLTGLTKNAGDLLIAICIGYNTSTGTDAAFSNWSAGWNEFHDSATNGTQPIGMAYKWSTGSETGTFAVTQAGTITGHAGFILLSIPGAHASTPPEAGGRTSVVTCDPDSFDPSWGTEDTLWIAVGASGETGTGGSYTGITAAPTDYADLAVTGMSADAIGAIEGAVAFRQLNAASEDPGAFTNDTSNARAGAVVIAVRPVPTIAFDLRANSWRWRNDDGSETGATWRAAQNVNPATVRVDEPFRLRFRVGDVGGVAGTFTTPTLEYQVDSGGWNAVDGTVDVALPTSTHFADGDATTEQLTGGDAGSFVAGTMDENGAVANVSLGADGNTEIEWCVALTTDLTQGQTVEFRVTINGTELVETNGHPFASVLFGPELAVFESARNTTSPKTVVVTGAVTGDVLYVMAGGDAFGSSNAVTAATASTTGGSTSAWAELAESLSSANEDWCGAYKATVTGDGDITVSFARTQSGTQGTWHFWVAKAANGTSGGENVTPKHTADATEVINAAIAQDSAVLFASYDWDAATPGTFTPAGSTEVERSADSNYTEASAYWVAQAAGTRDYGTTGSSGTAIKAELVEILAAGGIPTVEGEATGSFTFTGTASGAPRTQGAAVGTLSFTGSASGVPRTQGVAAGSFTFTGTAAGKPFVSGQASGALTFTGTASGFAGTPPVQGQATGALTFTGTAVGAPRTQGVASASLTFTGTASGAPRTRGTAAASLTFTGSAAGIDRAVGTAAASLTFTGSASGRRKTFGTAAASLTFVGNATGFAGTPPVQGQASAALSFTGTASGTATVVGLGSGAVAFTGTAQGSVDVYGQASSTWAFTGTAVGTVEVFGTATGALDFIGTAIAPPPITRGAVGGRHRSTSRAHIRTRPTVVVTGRTKRIGSTSGGG